jgi:hypothetical protein
MSLANVGFGRSVAARLPSGFNRCYLLKNSGALYRMVPVYGVVVAMPRISRLSITRTKPKSQILATPSVVIRIFF